MAKKQNGDPDAEHLPADDDEKRLEHPVAAAKLRPQATPYGEGDPTPTPTAGETTRVLLTSDNRNMVTEAYVPTAEFGFRINVDGAFYEHVGEAADSGTWIFAPTR